eukprot:1007313-Pelagomonas_calceolata.AAC.1
MGLACLWCLHSNKIQGDAAKEARRIEAHTLYRLMTMALEQSRVNASIATPRLLFQDETFQKHFFLL